MIKNNMDVREYVSGSLYAISRLPNCKEAQIVAHQELLNALERIKHSLPPKDSPTRDFYYLTCLAELSLHMGRGDYIKSCNLLDQYIREYWEEGTQDGVISLLKTENTV